MFKKYLYLFGEKLRNPSLKKNYSFLKQTEKWSLEKLEEYQLEKLKELLRIAYHHSEYYRNKFNDIKLNINDIKTLEDIKSIPIISKKELINFSSQIQTNIKFNKTFLATTSGTSGESLKFYREEHADSFNRAAIQRGYSWYRVKPWDRNGYFWGVNFSFFQQQKKLILDIFQNRFRIFSYKEKSLKKFIRKAKKAKYIHGYSSMIYQTSLLINQLNLEKPKKIMMVKGTSEKIFYSYQKEVKKAFGVKIISEYGATESGIIAFECSYGNMHINMEGVLVESINNEILVTNLQMHSFPIIRYSLGDYITLAPRNMKCKCGQNHLILEEVTGRIGENIYGYQSIYPSLYLYYIFKNLSKQHNIKLNYQVLQEEKGFLIFFIEQSLNNNSKQKLIDQICKYFENDIKFRINDNALFIRENKGKIKNFISKIKK